jgi:hypothetical protein
VALALIVISGVAWTIVYMDSIRVGLRQKTYAMPVAALSLNFAWESTYAAHDLATARSVQGVIDVVWALADLVIVYTFVKFGRAEFPPFLTRQMFIIGAVLRFGTAYALQWLFIAEFGLHDAARYSAFLQNLLMSGLFIAMFVARRGLRGQTLTIAMAKWIGTLAPTVLFGAIAGSSFILGLGILCSVFDLGYIGLVVWARYRPDALAAAEPGAAERVPA